MSLFKHLVGKSIGSTVIATGIEYQITALPFTVTILQDHSERFTMRVRYYQRQFASSISSSLFNAIEAADDHIDLFKRKQLREGYDNDRTD